MLGNLGFRAAVTVKDTVAKKLEEERKKKEEKTPDSSPKEVETKRIPKESPTNRPEHYISDDDPDETSFV